ncbi:MAG: hypothetical protein ACRET2_16195, partial [Steroidobacteraceae bacterium]
MTKHKRSRKAKAKALLPDPRAVGGGLGPRRYFGEGGYADGGANQQGNYEARIKKEGPSDS